MKKKKTLYLHIGTHKTGTTSMQDFFTGNEKELVKHDLFYPRCKEGLNMNGWPLRQKIYSGGDAREEWKFLKNQIDSKGCSNVLISTEGFSINEGPEEFSFSDTKREHIVKLKNLLKGFNVRIIIYVRRSVDFSVSLYQEQLKFFIQDSPTFKEYTSVDLYYYKSIYSFAEIFGYENIILKPFEQRQFKNGDLIDDFLDIFDIKNSEEFNAQDKVNESFNIPSCKISRILPRLNISNIRVKQNIISNLLKVSAIDKSSKPMELLSNEEIIDICDKNYPTECQIAKDFLNRGELFIDKYPSIIKDKNRSPKPFEAPPEYWKMIDVAMAESLQDQNNIILQELKELREFKGQSSVSVYGFYKSMRMKIRKIRYKIKRIAVNAFCVLIVSKKMRSKIRKKYL